MFGDGENALKQALVQMTRAAWNNSLGSGVDPTSKLDEYIQSDLRFSQYDSTKLAAEALDKVRQGGSRNIDLSANLKGGSGHYLAGRIGVNHR
jgi:hypothetical protein